MVHALQAKEPAPKRHHGREYAKPVQYARDIILIFQQFLVGYVADQIMDFVAVALPLVLVLKRDLVVFAEADPVVCLVIVVIHGADLVEAFVLARTEITRNAPTG